MARLLGFLLMAVSVLLPAPASAGKRAAFVVGVDRYDNLDAGNQLKKAVNDAQAVAEALGALGYQVTKSENASRRDFLRQWQTFLNGLEPGDETAFYFAGHGVEIDGQNFLLPRDVPSVAPGEEEVMKAEGLALNGLLDQVRDRHPRVSLYVIDACRDNPFFDKRGRSVGGTRGLALVEPPSGTFVMFSAGKNETALDRLSDSDPDPNSIYTRTLLPRLKSPGNITDIARDVRRQVVDIARGVSHVQTPAYYDELVGDFCPAGCGAATRPEATEGPAPLAEAQPPAQPDDPKPASDTAAPPAAEPPAPAELANAEPRAPTPPEAVPAGPGSPPIGRAAPRDRTTTDSSAELFGMRLTSGEDQGARGKGVRVETVSPASEAKEKEIAPGDRILAVSGELVATPDDVARVAKAAIGSGRKTVLVLLNSRDTQRFVALKLDRMVAAANPGASMDVPSTPDASDGGDHAFLNAVRTLKADGLVWEPAFSPDGRLLAGALHANTVAIWDIDTGALIRTLSGHAAAVHSVAFTPDGSRLFSASEDKTVRAWSPASGESLGTLTGFDGTVHSVAVSPDGRMLASADSTGRIRISDATTLKLLRTLDAQGDDYAVYQVVFSPDGSRLAAASAVQTFLWDPLGGKQIWASPTPNYASTYTVAFSPDGRRLFTGIYGGLIRTLDVADGSEVRAVQNPASRAGEDPRDVDRLAITPDGRYLIAATHDRVNIWSLETTLLGSIETSVVTRVAVSRDGTRVAAAGSNITIYDVAGGAGPARVVAAAPAAAMPDTSVPEASPPASPAPAVRKVSPDEPALLLSFDVGLAWGLDLSTNGRKIATGSYDGLVQVWDAASGGLLQTLKGHSQSVHAVAFSPDGSRLASGADAQDSTVRIWDPSSGRLMQTLTGFVGNVRSLRFSPDGKLLAAGGGDVIWLFDTAKFTLIRKLDRDSDSYDIYGLAFSPDGARLAAGSAEKTFLWDIKKGRLVWSSPTPSSVRTHGLAFSPNGKQLVTGGTDGLLRTLDVANGKEVRSVQVPALSNGKVADVDTVVAAPDGRFVASQDTEGVRFWSPDGAPLGSLKTSLATTMALSRDGQRLLVAGGRVSIYDLSTARFVGR